jgi:hypothetical protein
MPLLAELPEPFAALSDPASKVPEQHTLCGSNIVALYSGFCRSQELIVSHPAVNGYIGLLVKQPDQPIDWLGRESFSRSQLRWVLFQAIRFVPH